MDQNIHALLCSACGHRSGCALAPQGMRPALYCEEFEIQASATTDTDSQEVSPPLDRAPAQRPKDYKGLCDDCANRGTCSLTSDEGGIWHCEEYR